MSSLSTQVLMVCPCVARGAGHVEASPPPMVLSLLELPPELQALFVLRLADAATAGRLAQASHTCKELLEQRPASRCAAQRAPLGGASPDGSPASAEAGRSSSSSLRRSTVGLFTDAGHTWWRWAHHVEGSYVCHTVARSRCSCCTCSASTRPNIQRSCCSSHRCDWPHARRTQDC